MKKNTKLTEKFIVQKNNIWTSVDMTYFGYVQSRVVRFLKI